MHVTPVSFQIKPDTGGKNVAAGKFALRNGCADTAMPWPSTPRPDEFRVS